MSLLSSLFRGSKKEESSSDEFREPSNGRKKVQIVGSLFIMTVGTNDFQDFNQDRYIKDYQQLLDQRFPEYEITYSLHQTDIKGPFSYPYISGEIDGSEKERIESILDEEPFFTYFASGDYFTHKPNLPIAPLSEEEIKQKEDWEERLNNAKDTKFILEGNYDLACYAKRELNPIELEFLKYITKSKKKMDYIALEWSLSYKLNYQDLLNQYVGQQLVEIRQLDIVEKINLDLTIKDLTKLLDEKNLHIKGKKSSLVEAYIQHMTEEEKREYNEKKYIKYVLSEKGEALISDISPSLTKDMDFEDRSFELVKNGHYEESCSLIRAFREKYNINIGLSFSIGHGENREYKFGNREEFRFSRYDEMRKKDFKLPLVLKKNQDDMNCCIIVGDLFNSRPNHICDFILRKTEPDLSRKLVDEYIEQVLSFLRKS